MFRRREDGEGRRLRFYLAGAIAVLSTVLLIGVGGDITGSVLRPAADPPSGAQVARQMWRTVLAALPLEHFVPAGQLTTISDGSEGYLSAEVGAVMPTTDGDGQLVFFWHDRRFVGWDSRLESMVVLEVQPLRPRSFRVTFANYAPADPACCPSLIPVSVVYRWNGHHFIAQGGLPAVTPIPAAVRMLR